MVDSQRQCDQNKKGYDDGQKITFPKSTSRSAPLRHDLLDYRGTVIDWFNRTGPKSLQLFKYRRNDPTLPTSAKNHFSVQLHMIEITFTIASILMQNVI